MKRGKRMLIMLGILAVLVAGALIATTLNPENTAEATNPTEAAEKTVFSLNTTAVTDIIWDYSEKLHFTRTKDHWVYAEDAAFPLDSSYLNTILSTLSQVTASRTLENVQNWEEYGLETPVCSVTVTAGKEYRLDIGSESAIGSERYLSIGDGNVYLVDAAILDCFAYGLFDLLAEESLPAVTNVTALELESETHALKISHQAGKQLAYSDAYEWFSHEENGIRPLDAKLAQTLVDQVTGLTLDTCADYHVTEAELVTYGLDTPAVTVTLRAEETFTLNVGHTEEGCYVRLADSSMVYRIDSALCDTLRNTSAADLMPSDVLALSANDVTAMQIHLDGQTYEITRQTADASSTGASQNVYMLGEREVDFAAFFSILTEMESTGIAYQITPQSSEAIRFVLHQNVDAFPQVTLSFHPVDSTTALVTLDGESTVYVAPEAVTGLIETVNAFVKG